MGETTILPKQLNIKLYWLENVLSFVIDIENKEKNYKRGITSSRYCNGTKRKDKKN